MAKLKLFIVILCCLSLSLTVFKNVAISAETKKRIMVVSSYHKEYLWSQDTNKGVCAALLDYKYLDNEDQAKAFTKNDYVESSGAIIKKLWMDTKRKTSRTDIGKAVGRIVGEIDRFNPDIILLGDDNAANYIGNQYIDTEIPIVFWGINGLPLKYGLLDSVKTPGHNVTGIYQAGYLQECLLYLKKLVPSIKTFAILSDDSPTGRSKAKQLERMSEEGKLPVKLIKTVVTNSVSEWKSNALELEKKVDAFFVLNHNTLKDDEGRSIDQMEIGAWYLRNIKKPDVGHEKQFVTEGVLCAVDDSGFKQGYEAVKTAFKILEKGENPAVISSYAPERGPFIVNRERAGMLGINNLIDNNPIIDEFIEKSLALEKYPE